MTPVFGCNNVAVGHDSNTIWTGELDSHGRPIRNAKRYMCTPGTPSKCRDGAVGENQTNSQVGVSNNNAAVLHYSDTYWIAELSSHGRPIREAHCATPSKRCDGAVECNKTNSIVAGVSNNNGAVLHDSASTWMVELSSRGRPIREATCATPSKCCDGAVGGNKANSIVVVVSNNNAAVLHDSDTIWIVESGSHGRPVREATCATSKCCDGAVGGNKTNSIVVVVSNNNAAVLHDSDTTWIVESGSHGRPICRASCATPRKCRDHSTFSQGCRKRYDEKDACACSCHGACEVVCLL